MCLPIKCLKTIVGFFAFLTICASLASIIVGIIFITKDASQFWKNTDWKSYVYGPAFLIALGVLILILGLFGMIGAIRKNGCCLTIYNLGNIPFSIGFIILGAVVTNVIVNQEKDIQMFIDSPLKCKAAATLGNQYAWISGSEDFYTNVALPVFGKDDTNMILIRDTDAPTFTQYLTSKGLHTSLTSGKINVISYLKNLTPAQLGYQALLEFQEATLKCAGMCNSQQGYYIFTDINNGFTKGYQEHACIYYLKEFLSNFGQAVIITCFLVGALLLVNSVLAFCLCCHPKKKAQGGNFYQRMSYTEDD